MKISFIRGAYLNNFEGQNYALPITGYSSLFPLDTQVPFPVIKLLSIADLQRIPYLEKPIKYIANRTWGDSQILFGLESHITHSDIVHVADPHYYYAFQAAQLKKKGKIRKLISTWWETIPFNNESTFAKKRLKKFVMSQADLFLCYTERARECLITEGVRVEKISVIPLGVDLKRFHPNENKAGERKTILFVGRLVEEKGILDLYEAFKKIIQDKKPVSLKIVGSGPLESKLRALIQKDNLQEYVTIEQKSYQEMPEAFRQADMLCVPSKKTKTWEEQLGMVFIEAMASGIPIITYNTGAIKGIVGDAGIAVDEGDIQGLVTSIIRIIEVKELGYKIGTIGRERAERLYDAQKTKANIYTLYKTLDSGL